MPYSASRKLTWMNGNWTRKFQVTLLSVYISWKKFCSHIFKVSSEEVILLYTEKMKTKYMEDDVWKFFSLTRRLASRNFITD